MKTCTTAAVLFAVFALAACADKSGDDQIERRGQQLPEGGDPGDDGDPTGGHQAGDCTHADVLGDWLGSFTGTLTSIGIGSLDVTGDMALTLSCQDVKIVVSGSMNGEGCNLDCAPFTADLAGEFNATTNVIHLDIQNGEVDLGYVMAPFSGVMDGTYDGERLSGDWSGSGSVNPGTGPITVNGSGDWSADLQ